MVVLMAEIKLILNTHAAYFKRHPWLLLLFVVGLSLGSALLTAIAGLNQEAKDRHQNSSALIDTAVSHIVKPLIGQDYIDGKLWIKLRQHGFTNAQPVLRGKLKLVSGQTLYLQGIDSLIWMTKPTPSNSQNSSNNNSTGFAFDSIIIGKQQAEKLKLDVGSSKLALMDSPYMPNFTLADEVGMWSITDIAYADMLLQANGKLSFIEFIGLSQEQEVVVEALLANEARLIAVKEQDFDALSEAFFFNLAALALLGYIVAAFLSFNAIKLSIAGRKKLLGQFNVLGCSPRAINMALFIEFIAMSFFTALLGSLLGFFIANALVLDINRTLVGLYQLEQTLTINWQWQTLILGFVVNLATLAIMLLSQKGKVKSSAKQWFYLALTIVISALGYFYVNARSEFDALVLCFFLLLLFVLITPKCLQSLLSFKKPFSTPLWQWLYADSKVQLKELAIAIIAILVALGSAIGMQIMVKSFSNTLNAHLEKQLSADVYIHLDKYDANIRTRLETDNYVKRVGIYMAAEGYLKGNYLKESHLKKSYLNKIPTSLISFGQGYQAFTHINLTSGESVKASHFSNNGCIANEQAKIKYHYQLGDKVAFEQNQDVFECRISAFAYDYGNTALSLITQEQSMIKSPLHWQVHGLSVTLKQPFSVEQLTERLVNDYAIDSAYINENKRFKDIANRLFNDTFQVTKVLNGFILAIALVSLCISLLSLSAQHAQQLAVLNSLGVDAKQLQKLKLVQTSLLVVFTCVFAIPLGFALGFALLKFVMPIAFGWTIHFYLDLPALLSTCLLLILAAVLCAYLPVKRLTASLQTKDGK